MNKPPIITSDNATPAAVLANGKPGANGKSARKAKPRKVAAPQLEDSVEARSRALLAAMVAFRDGDFSVRLPTDWDGTEGRIAAAFNQALAHEDRISREVSRLSV